PALLHPLLCLGLLRVNHHHHSRRPHIGPVPDLDHCLVHHPEGRRQRLRHLFLSKPSHVRVRQCRQELSVQILSEVFRNSCSPMPIVDASERPVLGNKKIVLHVGPLSFESDDGRGVG
ncbi:hypothetical protein NGA_2121300, partial [Nannochloropsis gaditana CCMP526]|uniref:uncharacterized protein n=1 Tax=Nannochloropsis gaditana (strain CCMP526) TaxID=1093141 RepID=UPI00029F7AB5